MAKAKRKRKGTELDLQGLSDFFFGKLDSSGHLVQSHWADLGDALRAMERGDNPVSAITYVLPKHVTIKHSDQQEVKDMFQKGTRNKKTGQIQVRETLMFVLDRFRNYPGKINKDQKPPDPWGA
jgi:hypothetical protein